MICSVGHNTLMGKCWLKCFIQAVPARSVLTYLCEQMEWHGGVPTWGWGLGSMADMAWQGQGISMGVVLAPVHALALQQWKRCSGLPVPQWEWGAGRVGESGRGVLMPTWWEAGCVHTCVPSGEEGKGPYTFYPFSPGSAPSFHPLSMPSL